MDKPVRAKRHFSTFQIISIGMFALILIGALLLMLPIATQSGESTSFIDALFTSTSAVCVTGLIVFDTATHWSLFGQAVIIGLIQVGGMGFVSFGVLFAMIAGKRIGLMQRNTMVDAISAHKVGGIVRLTRFILIAAFAVELIGAAVMSPIFIGEFGVGKGIWYSLFHSISAFCNAGFDLMGVRQPFSSLTSFSNQPVINITIMALILIGGLGFLTWGDMREHKWRLRKYSMQSKVILFATVLLVILPAVYFYFAEFGDLDTQERVLASLFQSVTPRTAGFNTVDLTALKEGSILIMTVLMLIGAGPGSTAGGIKVTTVAVLLANALSVFSRKDSASMYGRRIANDTVRNAATILVMYLVLFLTGSTIISLVEGLPILTCFFEAGSAIATVGLTLGVTPTLCSVSKLILILLMFFGRVGGLTLVFSAVSGYDKKVSQLPQEKITVG